MNGLDGHPDHGDNGVCEHSRIYAITCKRSGLANGNASDAKSP
jgi:hypothetical protein